MEDQDIFYKGNGKKLKNIASIKDGELYVTNIQLAVRALSGLEPIKAKGRGETKYNDMDKDEYRQIFYQAHVQPPCVLKRWQ